VSQDGPKPGQFQKGNAANPYGRKGKLAGAKVVPVRDDVLALVWAAVQKPSGKTQSIVMGCRLLLEQLPGKSDGSNGSPGVPVAVPPWLSREPESTGT
jgi:hypothetical protein